MTSALANPSGLGQSWRLRRYRAAEMLWTGAIAACLLALASLGHQAFAQSRLAEFLAQTRI